MGIQRDQILRCARDLYLTEGIEGFSMRKLAKCVGCTAPALYRHYESKEEVMREVVVDAYGLFTQYLYRALEGTTPVERFLGAGRSYFDFALEQPALYEIIYVPAEVLGAQSVDASITDQASAVGQFWSDRVREMMDAGYLKKGDPIEIATTLWGHAHGLISIYHRGLLSAGSVKDFRALMTESFFRIMKGLGTEAFDEVADQVRAERASEALTA
jgi:AcrR family transcriptional regulator